VKLIIVRHGIAVPRETAGVPDEERQLTDEGIRKMSEAALGYRALGFTSRLILTSPLLRSRQTAEILRKTFGRNAKVQICDALSPEQGREGVYEAISKHSELEALTLVGHQPSLGEIAAEIAFGSASRCLDLRKGGGCGIDVVRLVPHPEGTLEWLLPASLIRRVEMLSRP
jgi:phosphohistidine phosphatase